MLEHDQNSMSRTQAPGPGTYLGPRSSVLGPSEVARQRFSGKRVTVVGVAREGLSLVRFLTGVGAKVAANDRAAALPEASAAMLGELGVPTVLGGHPEELFLQSDVVFVSPGVPQELPAVTRARAAGVPTSSETQLFFELCRGTIVGITGSSGKTTTTALTGEMFRSAGLTVHVGGNIGMPLLERVDEIAVDHWVVLEMSSFQLETLPYSPPIAAILNITPNHLDRHSGMDAYVAAKTNIVRSQNPGDRAILNADDPIGRLVRTVSGPLWFSLERRVEGGFLAGGEVMVRRDNITESVCRVADVRLRGRHNLANVVAAVTIGSAAGLPRAATRQAILGFSGVPHRLEIVAVVDGVTYCNDSIATAPERAMASLRSFDQPIVLIACGRNKKLPLDDWARLIREKVRVLVVMGESAAELEQAVRLAGGGSLPRIVPASSMEEAVETGRAVASHGDVVLLAPGFTSFDMFKDFEERGERFRQVVGRLVGASGKAER